jgi:hypothetical protein
LAKPVFAIATLYYGRGKIVGEELRYFRKIVLQGQKIGVNVFVFTPEDVDSAGRRIYAHFYDSSTRRWIRKWTALPDVVYDRCRYQPNERFKQFKDFRARYRTTLTFLNTPLANKWAMHQVFEQNPSIRPHLPLTRKYNGKTLKQMVNTQPLVYLKPSNGTGGRGILKIKKLKNGLYRIQGRDQQRSIIPPQHVTIEQIARRLRRWNVDNRYLVQQGIDLALDDGRVHDFRLLIQKDHRGEWEVTGCAGRIGAKRSITSNLHGGGRAVPMRELLQQRFTSEMQIGQIQASMERLSKDIAEYVEVKFGKMCELGLDIAVDPNGRVWLLEINPKPAREVFAKIGEPETYEKAVRRPLEYALWLIDQQD